MDTARPIGPEDLEGDAGEVLTLIGQHSSDPELARIAQLATQLLPHAQAEIVLLDGDTARRLHVDDANVNVVGQAATDSITGRLLRTTRDSGPWLVEDLQNDKRFDGLPEVTGTNARVRCYAAAPVRVAGGLTVGAVRAGSRQANSISTADLGQLVRLADAAAAAIELRIAQHNLARSADATGWRVGERAASSEWTIEEVIDRGAVRTVFQPVIHLASEEVVGFEALSRGPAESAFESPEAMMSAATRVGRLADWDWLCRARALAAASAANLPAAISWMINVEPASLNAKCPQSLWPDIAAARTDLRVILEVIERGSEGYVTELVHAADHARDDTWGVALDDVGTEPAQIALLPFLQPDIVKLNMIVLRHCSEREAMQVSAAVCAYAERTGAAILAEGIETTEDAQHAMAYGATFGQGYLFGAPGELPDAVRVPRHVIPLRQKIEPVDGRTPFEVVAPTGEPRSGERQYLRTLERRIIHQAREAPWSVLLLSYDSPARWNGETEDEVRAASACTTLTAVSARGISSEVAPGWYQGPPKTGSAMENEWFAAVISPHFASAFLARRASTDSETYDYHFTHDRALITAAMRAYLAHSRATAVQRLRPGAAGPERSSPVPGGSAPQGGPVPSPTPRGGRFSRVRGFGLSR